jgi:polar amino acid transport system substrate-binding protein
MKDALLAWTLFALVAGCGIPRDPEGTLERVADGTMRVGITERPPWSSFEEGDPSGVEIDLIQGFTESIDADIEWFEGAEAELLAALEHRELDLVIGGLTVDDPWGQIVTFTQPYAKVATLVGVQPGEPPPEEIDGVEVAVEPGSELPALVRSAGGIPVILEDLSGASGPVAAEEWRIEVLGLVPTDIVLDEAEHAVAVPVGENAWLVRLERYLGDRAASVDELLRKHAVA